MALRTGDFAAVGRWSEQRLALGRAREDAPVIARSLVGLAHAAWQRGDQKRAQSLFLEASEVARGCGDTHTLEMAETNLGILALEEGDAQTARLYLEHALVLSRERSDALAESEALAQLAWLALDEGEIDEAAILLADGLRLASRLGDMEGMFLCLIDSAELATRRGETLRAARLLGAADALRTEIGYRPADVSEQDERTRITDSSNPVQRLVAACVGVDEHGAVVLQHQQARRVRQEGVQAAGVGDFTAGDDQTHGGEDTTVCFGQA